MKKEVDDIKPKAKDNKKNLKLFSLSPITSLLSVIFIYFASQVIALNVLAAAFVMGGKTSQQVVDLLRSDLLVQAGSLLLIAIIVTLLVKLFLKLTGTTWKHIGLKKPKFAHLGQALIGYGWYFLFLIVVMAIVGQVIPGIDLNQEQQLGFDRGATGASLWIIGISLVLIPAFYEELLMRGVLFTGLRSKLPFWTTSLIIGALFGVAHLEWLGSGPLNWAAAIDTFMLSLVLVYLREHSKSLWPAIFLHALKNLVAFSLVFVFKVAGV